MQNEDETIEPFIYPQHKHPSIVYISSLSKSSQRPMSDGLLRISQFLGVQDSLQCPWHKLERYHVDSARQWLIENYSASSANRMLAALRGVLKHCLQMNYLSGDQYLKLVKFKLVEDSGRGVSAGRVLTDNEIRKIFNACRKENNPDERRVIDIRDTAILALMIGAGLSRSEIVDLDTSGYDRENRKLTIKGRLENTRTNRVHQTICDDIDTWLSVRGDCEPLFCRIRKSDQITGLRLTDQSVYHITMNRADESGVESFSPQDLRCTFASNLFDDGIGIDVLGKLMGHALLNTTNKYNH